MDKNLTISEIICANLRSIPDYPKPGIIFKDVTTLLDRAEVFSAVIRELAAPLRGQSIDYIAGIESRGFIFGAPLATELGCGFIPVRKAGKLPWKTVKAAYSLEYGEAEIEVHEDALNNGNKVVLIDDLLATGGTAAAAAGLLEKIGAEIIEVVFVLELDGLGGRAMLGDRKVRSLRLEPL